MGKTRPAPTHPHNRQRPGLSNPRRQPIPSVLVNRIICRRPLRAATKAGFSHDLTALGSSSVMSAAPKDRMEERGKPNEQAG